MWSYSPAAPHRAAGFPCRAFSLARRGTKCPPAVPVGTVFVTTILTTVCASRVGWLSLSFAAVEGQIIRQSIVGIFSALRTEKPRRGAPFKEHCRGRRFGSAMLHHPDDPGLYIRSGLLFYTDHNLTTIQNNGNEV